MDEVMPEGISAHDVLRSTLADVMQESTMLMQSACNLQTLLTLGGQHEKAARIASAFTSLWSASDVIVQTLTGVLDDATNAAH